MPSPRMWLSGSSVLLGVDISEEVKIGCIPASSSGQGGGVGMCGYRFLR